MIPDSLSAVNRRYLKKEGMGIQGLHCEMMGEHEGQIAGAVLKSNVADKLVEPTRVMPGQLNCAASYFKYYLCSQRFHANTQMLEYISDLCNNTMSTESDLELFLEKLFKPPEGEFPTNADFDQYRRNWGFTIYRTFYGPNSDEQWRKLLEKITKGAKYELNMMEDLDVQEPTVAFTKAWNLFRLDARSDPSTLDGLTLENVRQLYLDGTGGQPMNVDIDPWRVFLLADEAVLASPELSVINVVDADYDPVRAAITNPRVGPQRYFGWITMSPSCILILWKALDIYLLSSLGSGPDTTGGPGGFWDADSF
jgi:hypothetical protein